MQKTVSCNDFCTVFNDDDFSSHENIYKSSHEIILSSFLMTMTYRLMSMQKSVSCNDFCNVFNDDGFSSHENIHKSSHEIILSSFLMTMTYHLMRRCQELVQKFLMKFQLSSLMMMWYRLLRCYFIVSSKIVSWKTIASWDGFESPHEPKKSTNLMRRLSVFGIISWDDLESSLEI